MRALVFFSSLLLAACGGGNGAAGGRLLAGGAYARLIEGANSGTIASLTDGSTVLLASSGSMAGMTFTDPGSAEAEPLGGLQTLARVAPDGRLLWQREVGSQSYNIVGLHATTQGTFWVFALARETVVFDGFTADADGFPTMVFGVYYDANGNVLRGKVFARGNGIKYPVFALGADGTSAMVVTVAGTTVYNPGEADKLATSNSVGDLTALRYDAQGRILWRRRVQTFGLPVTASAACLRPDGDLVLGINYEQGKTTIAWLEGVPPEDSPRLQGSGALLQYDDAGSLVHYYEAPSGELEVYEIAPHLDGHVVVGWFDGLLEDDGGNNDLATSDGAGFVRRCGEDGRAIWTVPQRSSADDSSRFFSVDTTADGNILLAGGFDGHAVFETTGPEYVVDSLGREDGILMLLRADGQPAWVRTIQSPDWSVMGPARFVGNSEIAVKGESSGSFLWSGTELGEIDVAGDTIFLLRLALETSPE